MRVFYTMYQTVTVNGNSGKIVAIDATRGYLVSFEDTSIWFTASQAGRLFDK